MCFCRRGVFCIMIRMSYDVVITYLYLIGGVERLGHYDGLWIAESALLRLKITVLDHSSWQ